MSLVLSWNGLIIFSSRTDQSLCNVSHFFKVRLSSESTLPVMWAILRVSLDIAVITRRAFRYLSTAACFLLCQKTALSWHLCWTYVLVPCLPKYYLIKLPFLSSYSKVPHLKLVRHLQEDSSWLLCTVEHRQYTSYAQPRQGTEASLLLLPSVRSSYQITQHRCTSWLCPSFPNT